MYFGSDEDVFERPLLLAGCASLRAADGRACVGSRRERSAPFEFPPGEGWSAGYRVTKHDGSDTAGHECAKIDLRRPTIAVPHDPFHDTEAWKQLQSIV